MYQLLRSAELPIIAHDYSSFIQWAVYFNSIQILRYFALEGGLPVENPNRSMYGYPGSHGLDAVSLVSQFLRTRLLFRF